MQPCPEGLEAGRAPLHGQGISALELVQVYSSGGGVVALLTGPVDWHLPSCFASITLSTCCTESHPTHCFFFFPGA